MKLKLHYKIALLVAGVAVLSYVALVGARIISYTGGEFSQSALNKGLIAATESQDLLAMRILIATGADPDARGKGIAVPPLSVAARENLTRSVRVLVSQGANPNGGDVVFENPASPPASAPGKTSIFTFDRPMFVAASRGHRDVAELLRSRGARYELIDAVFLLDDASIRRIQRDSDAVSRFNNVRDFALILAVNTGNLNAVRKLLELGADPYSSRVTGTSAWDDALDQGRTEVVKLIESTVQANESEDE